MADDFLKVDFDINKIFNRINEDNELKQLMINYNIIFNEDYENEVRRRIENVYKNGFNLNSYLLGLDKNKSLRMYFRNEINYHILISKINAAFRLKLLIGEETDRKAYTEEFNNLNLSNLFKLIHSGTTDSTSNYKKLIDNTFNFTDKLYEPLIVKFTSGVNIHQTFLVRNILNSHSLVIDGNENEIFNTRYELYEIPSIKRILSYFNNLISEVENIYIKDYVRFDYDEDNEIFYLILNELDEEIYKKITLTISDNGEYSGRQTLSDFFGYEKYGETKSSNFSTIDYYLNNEESGYISYPPPWLSNYKELWNAETNIPDIIYTEHFDGDYYKVSNSSSRQIGLETIYSIGDIMYYDVDQWKKNPKIYEYTNYELLIYCFYLDDIYNNYHAKYNICKKLLYHYKYMGDEWFFLKNQNKYLAEVDRYYINKDPKVKVFIDSILVELDRLSHITEELNSFKNIDLIPSQFLDYIAEMFGFDRKEYEFNVTSFRELLKNIVEIYKIKGTNLSVENFFNFLGFKVDVEEYWFDRREVLNKGKNLNTGVSEYNKYMHYLVSTNPTLIFNKYKGIKTYNDLYCYEDLDLITKDEIQSTKNILDFEKIAQETSFDYTLKLLGFKNNPAKLDGTWSLNVDQFSINDILNKPKFPYYYGEILNEEDLSNLKLYDENYYYENDFNPFEKDVEPQELKLNNESYFIDSLTDSEKEDFNTFEYFKTNFILIKLYIYKNNLTTNELKVILNYFRKLFPSYVIFEPQIVYPNQNLETMPLLVEDLNIYTYKKERKERLKYNKKYKYNHEIKYNKTIDVIYNF